ncbi:hypothetical protein HYY74_06750 [Candidatus Woesearchaeota archaeon]|nr:hypothetical protein [Candidatus Woesearchaeota archaeon]
MAVDADNITRLVSALYSLARGTWGRHLLYRPAIEEALAYRATVSFSVIPEAALEDAKRAIVSAFCQISSIRTSEYYAPDLEHCHHLLFSASAVRRIARCHFPEADFRPQIIGYLLDFGLPDRNAEMLAEVLVGPPVLYNGGPADFRAFLNGNAHGLERRLLAFFSAELKTLNTVFRQEAFTKPYAAGAVEAAQALIRNP